MALTDSTEKEVLRFLFGRIPFDPPPIYYAGLSSTAINEDGSGATEPSSGGYARVAIPNIDGVGFNFSGGQITNGTQVSFPTATGPWSQQNYIAFFDQAVGGTVKMKGSLSPAQTIDTNQRMFFDTNDLVLTLT